MISAKFTIDEDRRMVSLKMDGHANSADYGHDLVCASASMLAYTLAQNVKMQKSMGLIKYEPTIKLKSGKASIICRAVSDEAFAEICHAFVVIQTGFQVLAHNYPEYVVLMMFGETEQS